MGFLSVCTIVLVVFTAVSNLPIGCIDCSRGALELWGPKIMKKGQNFLEIIMELLINLGAQNKFNPALNYYRITTKLIKQQFL